MGSLVHTLAYICPNMKFLVLAARAAHLATKGAVYGAYPYAYAGYPYAYAGYPYANAYAGAYPYAYSGYPYAHAYAGYPYGGLVAHPNGAVVPVDEPAVAAAKADFAAAGGVINPVGGVAYAAGFPY